MALQPDPYTAALQVWTQGMEDMQQAALAWQQAITAIQTQRARAIGLWWQQAPVYSNQLLASKTPAEVAGVLSAWNGQTLAQTATLACDITAQRGHLLARLATLSKPLKQPAAQLAVAPAPAVQTMSIAATTTNGAAHTSPTANSFARNAARAAGTRRSVVSRPRARTRVN